MLPQETPQFALDAAGDGRDQLTDAMLLDRFGGQGDPQAFAEIVRRYATMVFSACHRILHDRCRAEDISQETFFRLMRHPRSVHQSLGGWLHQVATRLAIDVRRSENARLERERKYALAGDAQRQVADEEAQNWASLSSQLDQILEEMPPQLRSTLVSHFLRGKTQAQLAQEMATSPATISRRIKEALVELHRRMEGNGKRLNAAIVAPLLYAHAMQPPPPALMGALGKMSLLAGSGWLRGPSPGGARAGGGAMAKIASVIRHVVGTMIEPAFSQSTWGAACVIAFVAAALMTSALLSRLPQVPCPASNNQDQTFIDPSRPTPLETSRPSR